MIRLFLTILAATTMLLWPRNVGAIELTDSVKLNSTYQALVFDTQNESLQRAWFDAMPASSYEIIRMFKPRWVVEVENMPRYVDSTGNVVSGPLKSKAYDEYDNRLFMLFYALKNYTNLVPDSIFCPKLINMSVGLANIHLGDESDKTGQLQHIILNALDNRGDTMMELISRMSAFDMMQFWLFVFRTGYQSEYFESLENLCNRYADKYPEQCKAAQLAFSYAWGQDISDEHDHLHPYKPEPAAAWLNHEGYALPLTEYNKMKQSPWFIDQPWYSIVDLDNLPKNE